MKSIAITLHESEITQKITDLCKSYGLGVSFKTIAEVGKFKFIEIDVEDGDLDEYFYVSLDFIGYADGYNPLEDIKSDRLFELIGSYTPTDHEFQTVAITLDGDEFFLDKFIYTNGLEFAKVATIDEYTVWVIRMTTQPSMEHEIAFLNCYARLYPGKLVLNGEIK